MASKEEMNALGISTHEECNNENNRNNNQEMNTVAKTMKIIAIIVAVGGLIFGLYTIDGLNTDTLVAPIIIISIVLSVFIYGLGEIIQTLKDIEKNTRKN